VPQRGGRLRRRRELYGLERELPGRRFSASGTVCRSAAGLGDVAEACDGSSVDCPADGFASTVTVCRSVAGVCDVAENCTGSGPSVSGGRLRRVVDGLPLGGRGLRRRRELHGFERRVSDEHLRVRRRPSVARR
jgi:hypothetical protein